MMHSVQKLPKGFCGTLCDFSANASSRTEMSLKCDKYAILYEPQGIILPPCARIRCLVSPSSALPIVTLISMFALKQFCCY